MDDKWRRVATDFASRKLGHVEDCIGDLKPARRKKIRSYFYRRAIDKKAMSDLEYQTKYSDSSWMPEEIKNHPELC